MPKRRKDFEEAMRAAGWVPLAYKFSVPGEPIEVDTWQYHKPADNGKVIYDYPAWLRWDGGEITEIPF